MWHLNPTHIPGRCGTQRVAQPGIWISLAQSNHHIVSLQVIMKPSQKPPKKRNKIPPDQKKTNQPNPPSKVQTNAPSVFSHLFPSSQTDENRNEQQTDERTALGSLRSAPRCNSHAAGARAGPSSASKRNGFPPSFR